VTKRSGVRLVSDLETEHPGHLGAQDTFYVGTLKGVGRIYQQTFIDTYSKVAFRKKIYDRLDKLQADLDTWLKEYNESRPHSGTYCFGKTPMQTFLDSVPLAKEKMLNQTVQTVDNVA
jgi:hypothetical protein